jgi:hypothetical protein
MSNEICPSCKAIVKKGSVFCQECGFGLKIEKLDFLTNVSKRDEFIGYIQIVSVVEIALGILIGLIGLLIFLFGIFVSPDAFKDEYARYFVDYIQIIIIMFGFLLILFGFLSGYFGIALFQLKQIGRIGTMLIGALHLIFLPFGTIFGISALILLIKPETVAIFRSKTKNSKE